ncbi:MAG TPA: hypothetical protein VMZ53_30850 [Kofleriaceae bacterium]|nr:hypothetical protein [Kofleriaceae bacterium]
MSRWLIIPVLLVGAGVAHADEPLATSTAAAPPDMSDQSIGGSIGVVAGGRTTPGGLVIAGHYLYQLADQDWFDGVAAFTFGGGEGACFRDRMNDFLCEHGLADGYSIEIAANVRRFLGGNGDFWPFIRAGAGLELVRFGDDGVTGAAIPLHAGGGLRVSVSPDIAITAAAELELGFGLFNHSLGVEPQLGASVSAGAEFRL